MVDVNYCIISCMIDMKFSVLCVLHKNRFIILTRSILYLYWYSSSDWLTKNHHKYFLMSRPGHQSHTSLVISWVNKQSSSCFMLSVIQIKLNLSLQPTHCTAGNRGQHYQNWPESILAVKTQILEKKTLMCIIERRFLQQSLD